MRVKSSCWMLSLAAGLLLSAGVDDAVAQSGYRGSGSRAMPATRTPVRRAPQARQGVTASPRSSNTARPRASGLLGTVQGGALPSARSSVPRSGYRPPATGLNASAVRQGYVRGRRSVTTGLQSSARPGGLRRDLEDPTDGETTPLGAAQNVPRYVPSPIETAILAKQSLRTWTDITGVYTTRARLLHHQGQTVWLRKEDGGLARLGIRQLSLVDQDYVRSGGG